VKKLKWIHGNKALIQTGHKTFDNQCVYVGTGNAWTTCQFSNYIRAYNKTVNPVGTEVREGYLQDHDLQSYGQLPQWIRRFVRKSALDNSVILYRFQHYNGNTKVIHGFIVTDNKHKLLKISRTGPTYKSDLILDWVQPYISEGKC